MQDLLESVWRTLVPGSSRYSVMSLERREISKSSIRTGKG